MRVELDQNVGR